MNLLFVFLFAGSPILGFVFAASLVGLHLPGRHRPPKINRRSKAELDAMQLPERKAARRHKAEAQDSPSIKPVPDLFAATWRQVLGLPLNEHRRSVAHQAYRTLARANHPDHSGSNEAMQMVNDAWRQARKELILQ